MKICTKCKNEKELSEYHRNCDSKDKLSHYCKECQKEHKKQHYKDNREIYNDNQYIHKKWFIDYKISLKCEKCGFSHPAALDFHHKDPKTKIFNVSLPITSKHSKEEIMKEIDKCIVLCANCHRIEHSTRYNKILNNEDNSK